MDHYKEDNNHYQSVISDVQVGKRLIRLKIPDPVQVKSEYKKKGIKDGKDFPFWTRVWPSAIALSLFIEKNSLVVQDRILFEIGAGLGLPSIVAAEFAKHIVCSDYLPEIVSTIQTNVDINLVKNIEVQIFDWRNKISVYNFDILLASDINYDPSQNDSVKSLFNEALARGKKVLFSTPDRLQSRKLIEAFQYSITKSENFTIEGENSTVVAGVYLLENDK
jgi:predicted nicotinamide N-methyase